MTRRAGAETGLRGLAMAGMTALGFGGLVWAAGVAPQAASAIPLAQMARSIIIGDAYQLVELQAQADRVDALDAALRCHTAALGSLLIVRSRIAELTLLGADFEELRPRMQAVSQLAKAVLACAPRHALAWFLLYWSEGHAEGHSARILPYLVASYEAGPREGWIATRRNALAVSVIERLEPSVQETILAEWAGLVDGHLFDPAALTLARAVPEVRERLLRKGHETVRPELWALFARRLDRLGIPIDLPGIEENRLRPWR